MRLQANLDRRLVPSDSHTSTTERYLQIQIIAPDDARPRSRLPINLALVIDRSGSMSGSKLERAKEAAMTCLRNLTGADRAAVISYDDNVSVVSPSQVLSPEAKNRMISDVRGIVSGGSTNLGGGWLTGAQEVANHQHEKDYLSRVILLSDGLANVGIVNPDELAHHATELRERGVSTTTMGIGADYDENLMERMAVAGGGHFYFIENSGQIQDMLHRELGEVMSTCARRVQLDLEVPEAVHAHLLNSFEVTREGKHFTIRLDDMLSGEVRTLLFRLTARAGREGDTLPFRLRLSYVDVESGETRQVSNNEAMLTYANGSKCAAEAPDPAVMEEVALFEAALAREQALKYDAEGNYAASAAALAQAATHMRTAAPASPAVMQEAQALEQTSAEAQRGLSAIKRKALHYDNFTRKQSREK